MVDQLRLELLMTTAADMGLEPEVVTDRGLVSIRVGSVRRYIFHKTSNPNDQMASWLSQNKYVSRIIFEKNGLPNIPFCLPNSLAEAKNFLNEHQKIIAKPVKGKQSQDIHLISTPDELSELDLGRYILEKFIKGQETRFLVVDGAVRSVHHKVYEADINDPHTVQRVALERDDWPEDLLETAIAAVQAVGLQFAAIDFLVTENGDAFILEINSAPGIERFQRPDQGPSVDAMRLYLELLVKNYRKV